MTSFVNTAYVICTFPCLCSLFMMHSDPYHVIKHLQNTPHWRLAVQLFVVLSMALPFSLLRNLSSLNILSVVALVIYSSFTVFIFSHGKFHVVVNTSFIVFIFSYFLSALAWLFFILSTIVMTNANHIVIFLTILQKNLCYI